MPRRPISALLVTGVLVASAASAPTLATPSLAAGAPAAHAAQADYTTCLAWAQELKDLKKRQDALQRKYDATFSHKKRKVLKKRIKSIKRQRYNLSRKMDRECTG